VNPTILESRVDDHHSKRLDQLLSGVLSDLPHDLRVKRAQGIRLPRRNPLNIDLSKVRITVTEPVIENIGNFFKQQGIYKGVGLLKMICAGDLP